MTKRGDSSKFRPSLQQALHEYHIVGRAAPTKKNPKPLAYRMSIFAKNSVLAKSRFWYFMKRLNKAKRSGGEILAVNELKEPKKGTVKNFGVLLRYDSRTGTHNMYKEYRDTTKCGAVSQMYGDMAGGHRARASCIQIIRVKEIADSECKKPKVTQFHDSKLKFPITKPTSHVNRADKKLFVTKRPSVSL
ncbi:60S ribosomal protein L18a, putative [Theileria equi strain WA]|uniref:60S ribosomal protein L18a n=1 Tax=Theileria equi strain WA TaxID=1537102 RepID=L0AWJ8_THEEQ|nr:60S ribosomal protein L18a, putative [Theileria equi strain WA]AFZ79910.1 60S ribosomal protein L18a, putative [Theileria equi strain WA]|eukprot:XP_004829576.1 60S ribosomal protein L18a, putative [Theileria equi strain WA]